MIMFTKLAEADQYFGIEPLSSGYWSGLSSGQKTNYLQEAQRNLENCGRYVFPKYYVYQSGFDALTSGYISGEWDGSIVFNPVDSDYNAVITEYDYLLPRDYPLTLSGTLASGDVISGYSGQSVKPATAMKQAVYQQAKFQIKWHTGIERRSDMQAMGIQNAGEIQESYVMYRGIPISKEADRTLVPYNKTNKFFN